MNYVIAVLSDRLQVEAAYSALEQEGFPVDKVNVLGEGYKTPDELGFADPKQQGQKRARLMAYWLIPFGFIGGVAFNLSTGFELFDWAGTLGNRLIGGLFGAIGGAMGGFFVGSGSVLASQSEDPLPYRDRLAAGKYLLIINAPANLTNKATSILRQLKPENIQAYAAPNRL